MKVVEDLTPEGEESPVDPQAALRGGADLANTAAVAERDRVKGLTRAHAGEAGDRALATKMLEESRERQI